jgi:hypothetical protein
MLNVSLIVVACVPGQSIASTPTALNVTPAPNSISQSPTSITPSPAPTTTSLPGWCPVVAQDVSITSGSIRIAYVQDGDLWIQDEGKEPVLLIKSGDVINAYLSDDGLVIAYTRAAGETKNDLPRRVNLWRIRVDTGEVKQLLSAEQFSKMDDNPNALGILPSGIAFRPYTHLLFFQVYPIIEGLTGYTSSGVWRVDADTGRYDQFLKQGMAYSFAPDGTTLALMELGEISLYHADGTALAKNLVPGYNGLGMGEYYAFPVAWARDNASLAIIVPADPADVFSPKATFTVWRILIENGQATQLGTFNAYAGSTLFSDDLSFMIFTRWLDQANSLPALILASTDGSSELTYATNITNSFGWRPGSYDFTYLSGNKLWMGTICDNPKVLLAGKASHTIPIWLDASRYYYPAYLETDSSTYDIIFASISPEINLPEPIRGVSHHSMKLIAP